MRRCLQQMIADGMEVATIATDQHLKVGKVIREEFPTVSIISFLAIPECES